MVTPVLGESGSVARAASTLTVAASAPGIDPPSIGGLAPSGRVVVPVSAGGLLEPQAVRHPSASAETVKSERV
jgi:hypothetical protein